MKVSKILENSANVAILVLALILVGFLARNYFIPAPHADSATAGERISLPDFDFTKSDRTILVALQHDCHFCQESAGFYQKLVQYAATDNRIQLIALFSEEMDANKVFLANLNLTFVNVKNVSFSSLKVMATPTILVVNRDGVIQSVWKGKLSDEKENAFFLGLN